MKDLPLKHVMGSRAWLCVLLLAAVLLAYANHFHNDFHFDDLGAIANNPAVRDLSNFPKAFVDPTLFSIVTEQRSYRPVLLASLILDYSLGGRGDTFFFHLSTFLWFALQLVLMFLLYERLMDCADPHPSNRWTALLAAALYGLHPANAETVNYVIQRADLYNCLGCVASLWLFVRYPAQRRFGWYLLPVVAAMLAKPPALIFPVLLLIYFLFFELPGKWVAATRAAVPAIVVSGLVGWFLAHMQPLTWKSGATSPFQYYITQPFVALHYFKSFFLPTDLSIDAGWHFVPGPFSLPALAGYGFVIGLLGCAVAASRIRGGQPVAFGICWFLAALLPTSLTPLADLMNDHRMFLPFVGLTLAVMWSLRMVLFRQSRRLTAGPLWKYGAALGMGLILLAAGLASRARNEVWSTEETVWRDATLKNPANGRAWINYGRSFFLQADYQAALESWQRAVILDPDNPTCHTNLARVYLQLHRGDLAEDQFRQLLRMDLPAPGIYTVYADWLNTVGRSAESFQMLERGARVYPGSSEIQAAIQAYQVEHAEPDTEALPGMFTSKKE